MRRNPILFPLAFLVVLSLFIASTSAGGAPVPVTLEPVPAGATPEQIQTLILHQHNIYFPPGEFKIGTLRIKGWNDGVIFGAGRMTTKLIGRIEITGSTRLMVGNLTVQDGSIEPGRAMIDITGDSPSDVSLVSLSGSAGTLGYPGGKLALLKGGTAIRMGAPGMLHVQGAHINGSDVGLSVEHPSARVSVFGGNYQADRLHLRQLQGQLLLRAVGTQMAFGGADVEIRTPSPVGAHLIEGIRSEGSNAARNDEVLLRVPSTREKVDVVVRGNCLGGLTQYADYNACGTLTLIASANYPDAPEVISISAVKSRSPGDVRVLSFGNKLGNAYDTGTPFDVGDGASVISTGDLWKARPDSAAPNPAEHFTEPVSLEALRRANKTAPAGVHFTPEGGAAVAAPAAMPRVEPVQFPVIANLAKLMTSVRDFGAVPDDGKDDTAALQTAIDSVLLPDGCSKPLYFPAGRYEVSKPLFLDHLAGGGFWGEGHDKSVIVSTSGKGVLVSDGAGMSTFVDIGFENAAGADSRTVYMGLWNSRAKDRVKHPDTGASTQGDMFYRTRFQGGGVGLGVGTPPGSTNEDGSPAGAAGQMGDGFMIVDSLFRNIHSKGAGAGYASQNYNTLTNPIVNSTFDDVDYAVVNAAGSFNAYGNTLTRIAAGGFRFESVVSDGFIISDTTLDGSPVELIKTSHSASAAHIVLERARLGAAATNPPGRATQYAVGGAIVAIDCDFAGRILSQGGGIGDNAMIVDAQLSKTAEISGRAHPYFFVATTQPAAK